MGSSLLQVALGGALGASARYLAGLAVLGLLGSNFPFGTLVVNVLGSFAMGCLFVALAEPSAARLSPLLMTGFLGGFTTFSAFSLDAMALIERGEAGLAGLYIALSVALSIGGLALGMALVRGSAA